MTVSPIIEITRTDPHYPGQLKSLLKNSVFAQGNIGLLGELAVGICGSRDASDAGIRHATEFGRIAGEADFVVVTGYPRGVDTAAHLGALDARGRTIAVLPEGIDHFRVRKQLSPLVTADNLLALSSFPPKTPWTTWNAMGRNKIIVGLSVALFVIEAGEKGGTLDAGLECLRRNKPLYVLEYPEGSTQPPGNKLLLTKGGIAIRTPRQLKEVMAQLRASQFVSAQALMEFD